MRGSRKIILHLAKTFCISSIFIAGANNDQKLAAIITPPVNPKAISKAFLFDVLNKKTSAAPKAVNAQVKSPA